MLEAAGALVAVVLLVELPGAALVWAIDPSLRSRQILLVSAAPLITIAANFAVAQAMDLVGLSVMPGAPLVVVAAALVGAVVRRWRTATEPRADAPPARSSAVDGRGAMALLGLAMVIGLTVWGVGLRGQPHQPPSRDGLYPGFFVERIVDTGTIDPARVVVTDPVTETPAAGFYPLALHTTVASMRSLTGVPIGTLLTVTALLAAAVLLPAGLFVLVRRLLPHRPLVAGFASLAVPLFAVFPYEPMDWSGIGVIVGIALVPVAAVLVRDAVDCRTRSSAVLAALACYCVIAVHTSQAALLAVVVGVLEVGAALARWSWPEVRSRARTLVAIAAGALLLYTPGLLLLGTASSERSDFGGTPVLTLGSALGALLTLTTATTASQSLLVAIAFGGVLVAARRRELGAWGVVGVALGTLYLATAVPTAPWSVLRPLTQPWYYAINRTGYHAPLVLAVFVGCALDAVVAGIGSFRWPRSGSAGVAVALAGVLALGLAYLPDDIDVVRRAYSTDSLVTPDLAAAFDYLDGHVADGAVVLNEERDGSAWMYAERGLSPLVGVYAYGSDEQNDDRLYLVSHIADLGSDPRVSALLERWAVTHVLVQERGFTDEPPRPQVEALRRNPGFREVFSSGGSHVFAVSDGS